MRLDNDQLFTITGKVRRSAQVKWFKKMLGVDVPFDERGPFITDSALQRLLEIRLGIQPLGHVEETHPSVRLRDKT